MIELDFILDIVDTVHYVKVSIFIYLAHSTPKNILDISISKDTNILVTKPKLFIYICPELSFFSYHCLLQNY